MSERGSARPRPWRRHRSWANRVRGPASGLVSFLFAACASRSAGLPPGPPPEYERPPLTRWDAGGHATAPSLGLSLDGPSPEPGAGPTSDAGHPPGAR